MLMLAIAGKGRTKAPKEYGDESDSSEIDRRKESRPKLGTKECTSTAATLRQWSTMSDALRAAYALMKLKI